MIEYVLIRILLIAINSIIIFQSQKNQINATLDHKGEKVNLFNFSIKPPPTPLLSLSTCIFLPV